MMRKGNIEDIIMPTFLSQYGAIINGRRRTMANYICRCGKLFTTTKYSVDSMRTTSCGCYSDSLRRGHELSQTRIYKLWKGMKSRCYNKKLATYKHYGGRGISVCERWRNSFCNFYDDMISTYSDNLTLDRINNNGNYEPSNCRWATRKEQSNNTRAKVYYTKNGVTKDVVEWRKVLGISINTYNTRRQRGWSVGEALKLEDRVMSK